MTFLRPHRLWIGLLVLAIGIMTGSGPALDYARSKAASDLKDVQDARAKAEQNLQQLRNDIETAQTLSSQIDRAHAEDVLAPADRLKAAALLNKEADAAQLVHFTYTLAPEEHVSLSAGGEKQDLAKSTVSLAGDAQHDLSVYRFIERAQTQLPGHAHLQELIVARAGTRLADTNVHFEATLEWLSNGTLQTAADGQ